MKFHKLLCLVLIFVSVDAFAFPVTKRGNESGNGGDVLICKDTSSGKTSYEILDLYEAKEFYHFIPDYGPKGLSFMEHVQFVLDRFARLDPDRARIYLNTIKEFSKPQYYIAGIQLQDIPDSQHLYIPSDCKIEQIAVQNPDTFPPRPKFVVNKDLWMKLDEVNRAALLLHEAVYKEAIESGATDSIRARYFHELLASMKTNPMFSLDKEYATFLSEKIKFRMFYKSGVAVENHGLEFYGNGILQEAPNGVKGFKAQVHGNSLTLARDFPVQFYENGEVRSLGHCGDCGVTESLQVGFKKVLFDKETNDQKIHFKQSGQVEWAGDHSSYPGYGKMHITVQGQLLWVKSARFFEKEKLVCFGWPHNSPLLYLKMQDGSMAKIESGVYDVIVCIDENDLVY